jgi:hypothetical protein
MWSRSTNGLSLCEEAGRRHILQTRKNGFGSQAFTWDYRNRLTAVVLKNGEGTVILSAGYEYDAFNRRVGRVVSGSINVSEQYLYDGTSDADVALVLDGEGAIKLRQLNAPGSNQVLDQFEGVGSLHCGAANAAHLVWPERLRSGAVSLPASGK